MMIKRLLALGLIAILLLGTVGLGSTPAAAQSKGPANAPNADLLPADTSLYFDFKLASLNDTLAFVSEITEKVTGQPLPPIYAEMDQGLSQIFGREVSFEKDILPMMGSNLTLGVRLTEKQYQALIDAVNKPNVQIKPEDVVPQVLGIIPVKDDAGMEKLVTDLLEKVPAASKPKTRTDTVGDNKVTIYDQTSACKPPSNPCASVAQWKGYIVIGTTDSVNDMLTLAKSTQPRLSADANFNKVMSQLKPENLLNLYITPRLYGLAFAGTMSSVSRPGLVVPTPRVTPQRTAVPRTPVPTPDVRAQLRTMFNTLAAVPAQGMGLRRENKVVALDMVTITDLKAMQKVYTDMGLPADLMSKLQQQPVDGKLAAQIPAKALGVVNMKGLSNLYAALETTLASMDKMGAASGIPARELQQVSGLPKIFDGLVKSALGLDLQKDVLSWMGGEFATYMVYNPDSVLTKLSTGSRNSSSWPFDHVLLLDVQDTAKVKEFLTKLRAAVQRDKNVKVADAEGGFYTLTFQGGAAIALGLSGNTFVVTTASGLDTAMAAVKGDGVISNSAAWKNAQAAAVKPAGQFIFVNLGEISTLIASMVPSAQADRPDTQMGLKLFDLFESAVISSGVLGQDGVGKASIQFILK